MADQCHVFLFGGFRAFFAKISDAFPLTLVCETSLLNFYGFSVSTRSV